VARHDVAVRAFTLFALTSKDITATIERGLEVVAEQLSTSAATLLEMAGADRGVVVHARGNGPKPGEQVDVSVPGPPAGWSAPVVVDGVAWGRLMVRAGRRAFTDTDRETLHAVASVLGAVIERDRVERGREALAVFGRFALQSREVSAAIEAALGLVKDVAAAPIGALIRLRETPKAVLNVVQISGMSGIDPAREYRIDPDVADIVLSHEPLIIGNKWTDERFASRLTPGAARWVACLAPSVQIDGRTWGRLVAGDIRPRAFSTREVEAASSAASLLTSALQRNWRQVAGMVTTQRTPGEPRSGDQTTEVALLDRDGVIVWVNRAWEQFCWDNGGDLARAGVGTSYLATCEAAADPLSQDVAAAVRAAVKGELPAPMAIVIPCHARRTARWFDLLISSRLDEMGICLGAAVTLSRAD
jgi:GAF domain-containing protein